MTAPHDCGRSIAGIVREIDELKAENARLKATIAAIRATVNGLGMDTPVVHIDRLVAALEVVTP